MTDTPARAEMIALLSDQWDALTELLAGLDEHRWRTPSPLPGWTTFDVLAHIVGTESLLLGEQPPAPDPKQAQVEVQSLPHVRNEVAVLNETWVRGLRSLSGEQLLQRFREVTRRRLGALAAMDDEQWLALSPSPVGEVPYARFMRVRLFDCWMHELDIADALQVQVNEGGPRAEMAFAEFSVSLPRVLVKLGKAPEGSRIVFELTGPLARTLNIRVNGRARYVDELDESPTVTIAMDSGLLMRLGGGRVTADSELGRIRFRGDSDLGRQLVRNLAFTI